VPERPRILLVVTLAETGGAQTYVASLLPALVGRFDVAVAAHGSGPLREIARATGAVFIPLRHLRRPVRPLRDVLGLLELLTVVRRRRPHIVHANSAKAGTLARLAAWAAGVPIRIYTVHGWAFLAHRGIASILYRSAERLLRRLTTITICVSESEAGAGLAARTCEARTTIVIRNGVAPRPPRAERSHVAPPRLLSVGRLQAPKDPLTLVRALAAVRPRRFNALIVGDGPYRLAVEAEIRRLGLADAVDLAGERGDVAELIAGAAAFVLSSRSEGLPLSILEAMAAGLPVVASRVGGVAELVVHGETGLLVSPGDPESFAAAVQRVLDDSDLRRRLGEAGRERVRTHFDLASVQHAHLSVYRRELASRGLPAPSP
jgi:glycosyltransferase involved in cell wall biosynthesis